MSPYLPAPVRPAVSSGGATPFACVLCGLIVDRLDPASVGSVPGNTRRFLQERFRLWRCPDCLTVHALDSVDLADIYRDCPLDGRRLDHFARATLGVVIRRLRRGGLSRSDRILDCGCGSGLLRVAEYRQSHLDSPIPFENYRFLEGLARSLGYSLDRLPSSEAVRRALTRPSLVAAGLFGYAAPPARAGFLDNAPTYPVFFNTAGGDPESLTGPLEGALLAISVGAVFMGANTYIGNAPNFMVGAIAQEGGMAMPSVFGYMLWSGVILMPLFVGITLIFFI